MHRGFQGKTLHQVSEPDPKKVVATKKHTNSKVIAVNQDLYEPDNFYVNYFVSFLAKLSFFHEKFYKQKASATQSKGLITGLNRKTT